ncbi:MAG: hypothetical protein HY862_11545 [Chloroflexi bacterium]|nr:hypothetical protein [Chloroflexota bacterium]
MPLSKSTPKRSRPIGQPTRGKTALNRLRQVDVYIALAHSTSFAGQSPLVVDVGYGAQAWTAIEMWERWLPFNPQLRLLGVEIDPERVAAARPYCQPEIIDFRLGGFNLTDVLGPEKATIIRAYNVLRQYEEQVVTDALDSMGQSLALGGILIEGTSNPSGNIVAFDIYEKMADSTLAHRELVLGTNFRQWTTPVHFQAILPKRLIHHMQDEAPARFFEAWQQGLRLARGMGQTGQRQQWQLAAQFLRERFDYPIDLRRRILRRGYMGIRTSLTP